MVMMMISLIIIVVVIIMIIITLSYALSPTQTQKLMEAQQKALGVSSDRVDSGKKKKKKDKPHTMSLDQFNQLPPERVPGSDEGRGFFCVYLNWLSEQM